MVRLLVVSLQTAPNIYINTCIYIYIYIAYTSVYIYTYYMYM